MRIAYFLLLLFLHPCCASQRPESDAVVFDSEFSVYYPGLRYLEKLRELPSLHQTEHSGQVFEANDSLLLLTLATTTLGRHITLNDALRKHLDFYLRQHPEATELMLTQTRVYLPGVKQLMAEAGLPEWFSFLPPVLSSMYPHASSATGGAGLWQLHYVPAIAAGLHISPLEDQRYEAPKAARAATALLAQYYQTFKEEHLAVLAHVCGAPHIQYAITRAGSTKYADIYPYLPVKSREVLTAIAAVACLVNHYTAPAPAASSVVDTDTLLLHRTVHFEQIEALIDIPAGLLAELNPSFIARTAPTSPGLLRVPARLKQSISENIDEIAAWNTEEYLAPPKIITPKVNNTPAPKAPINHHYRLMPYTVKPGDNLGSIAEKYGCKVADIMQVNTLTGTAIKAGKELKIPTAPTKSTRLPSVAHTYTVKPGDTLWAISNRYKGIDEKTLMSVNGIKDPAALRVGQVLKIPLNN